MPSADPGQLRRKGPSVDNPVVPRFDTAKWLDDDIAGAKLKNFDEMRAHFIEDLTNQFSDLLVPNYASMRSHSSVKLPHRNDVSLLEGDSEVKGGDLIMNSEDRDKKSDDEASADEVLGLSEQEDSDEDAITIPDEKPDQTVLEMDMLQQINSLETEEKHLDEEMKQKEALLEKIKEQTKEM